MVTDNSQQMLCFDRCQLIIKEVHRKPRLHVSVNPLLEYGRDVALLRRPRRRRRRPCAPTSNAASHDNHEKINSWISFSFLYEYGAPLLTKFKEDCFRLCRNYKV